jgi:hypothetical protein
MTYVVTCNTYETKDEYDLSMTLFNKFLNDSSTTKILSMDCIHSVKTFLESLQDKESQLATGPILTGQERQIPQDGLQKKRRKSFAVRANCL